MTIESIAPASPPHREPPAAHATPPTPIPVIPRVEFDYDVAVVGLGYVGLPTALALHASGARVLGIDASQARLDEICAGDADLLEFDRVRLSEALLDEQFTVTNDADPLSEAAAIVICVPTPIDDHLIPDLDILRAACATVVAIAPRRPAPPAHVHQLRRMHARPARRTAGGPRAHAPGATSSSPSAPSASIPATTASPTRTSRGSSAE